MRPFVVVAIDEVIELGLLLQEVVRGGLGGLFFQRQVHALVAAILLGMTGLDALDANAQAQPPDGELAQVLEGVGGGERHSVIRADGFRESELPEDTLEGAEGGCGGDQGGAGAQRPPAHHLP